MDETARQQTTKGIWLSRAKEDEKQRMGKNILVMDVEGTDGRERGEDQDFERKSALFALATSEVLVGVAFFGFFLFSLFFFPFVFFFSAHLTPFNRSRLSTFGSTRSVCTRAPIWDCSRPSLRSI